MTTWLKRSLLAALLLLPLADLHAQNASIVSPCGTAGYVAGQGQKAQTQDPFGDACTATIPMALTAPATSAALASNAVLKAAAGNFFGAQVNTTSAAEFVMLFNATALPANGAVTPVGVWQVPINTTLNIALPVGVSLSTGIVLGCSTTGPFTLTASTLCTFGMGLVQ